MKPIRDEFVTDVIFRDELHFKSHKNLNVYVRQYQNGELKDYPADISQIKFMLVMKNSDKKTHTRIPLTEVQRTLLIAGIMSEKEWAKVASKAILDII